MLPTLAFPQLYRVYPQELKKLTTLISKNINKIDELQSCKLFKTFVKIVVVLNSLLLVLKRVF